MPPRRAFDAAYYRRFYVTRPVHTAAQVGELAAGVVGLMRWWGIPLRSVLDVGAGPGYWRKWLAANRPRVRYLGVDVSEHACARYGHEQRDISKWHPSRPFDLVVCQGVLQYLDDAEAAHAIEHLAAATRHVLYLEVPTQRDRDLVVDTTATDMDVRWRTGQWYRRRLAPHFTSVGAGLWARHGGAVPFYELEV